MSQKPEKTLLERAYAAKTPDDIKDLYEDWAESYDAETGANGYATPDRLAQALHAFLPDPDTPILDYGCGTGLSGLALRRAGLTTVDGLDPSPAMLERARATGAYRSLSGFDIHDPAPIPEGAYRVITCVGVISTGAAPPSTFDLVMRALPKGGVVALSLNDHALADPAYTAALNTWLDCGAARLHVKEDGPHLPEKNLNSTIYIIEKL
jgi:predicted TPR repeat methyltransferase